MISKTTDALNLVINTCFNSHDLKFDHNLAKWTLLRCSRYSQSKISKYEQSDVQEEAT